MAPSTRSSVGRMSGCRFSVFNLCRTLSWEPGNTTKPSTCTKGLRVRPTSRAYSDANPGLVRPTAIAAVLLLEELCCRCRTAVVVVAQGTRSSLCWTQNIRCRFFVFILCRISRWGTTKHTTKTSTCTTGSRVRPTSRAYSDADPCFVRPSVQRR